MRKKLSYPYRTIRRNTHPELNLGAAKIHAAEGVRSKKTWQPRGGKWKKANHLEPFQLDDTSSGNSIVRELANEYLLSNIDGAFKIPRRPRLDLMAFPDIEAEINNPAQRENPIELIYMDEILTSASAGLEALIGGDLKLTPSIESGFRAELKNQLENAAQGKTSIDHYTVTIDTGLPKSTRLIKSWEPHIQDPITDFLNEIEPGIVVGISGFLLRGFKGSSLTIKESMFITSLTAGLENTDHSVTASSIKSAAAKWSRSVNKQLKLTIEQIGKVSSFYPLWIQVIKNRQLD